MKVWVYVIVFQTTALILKFNPMVGQSEAQQNALEKNWQDGFRRIWKTLFITSKAGKCHTFLVSLIIPLSWQEWFRSCFVTRCKIFLKITHQTVLTEAQPNTGLPSSEVDLSKFVLAIELFLLRPYSKGHLTARRCAKISWLPLQFILWRR